MAQSTCVKCGNHSFELVENSPIGSRYKFNFIQCSKCGGVVGVVNYNYLPAVLDEIEKKIDKIAPYGGGNSINASNFSVINENLSRLAKFIETRFNKLEKSIDSTESNTDKPVQ